MTDNGVVPAGFDRFFEDSFPRMLARALMLSGNRHDAEDAVQEAYAEALRRWDRVGAYDAPDAWVYLIMRQRLWKAAKRWRRSSSMEALQMGVWRAAPGSTEQALEARMVLAELAALPDRQRIVMVLHCLHGMEQQQIAELLGMTANSVRQSIFKARRKLAKVLGMARAGQIPNDALASATGPVILPTDLRPADDPTAMGVCAAENWLCEEIEAHEWGRDRIYRAIVAKASQAPS